ncbi:MAG: glycosyltransferase family 2 protein [Thermoplasmata archaeon]
MARPPRVALVVLNWNDWEDTRRCLDSLADLSYRRRETIVVDNGSRDGSPDRVAEGFPAVKLVRLPANRGYGGGMNAGIQAALAEGCDFVLCLNNDMTVEPGFLEPLVEAAGDEATVPYPAIYQGDHPDLLDSAGNRVSYTGLTGLVAHGAREIPPGLEVDYTELPLLPRALLARIGGYKEEYFAFYEDVDLGARMRAAGWTLRLVPESRVYHRRGRTTRRVRGLVSYYSVRNRLLLMRDNGTRGRWLLTVLHVLLLTLPFLILRALANPRSGHSPRHLLLGLVDGLLPWRRGLVRAWPAPP